MAELFWLPEAQMRPIVFQAFTAGRSTEGPVRMTAESGLAATAAAVSVTRNFGSGAFRPSGRRPGAGRPRPAGRA